MGALGKKPLSACALHAVGYLALAAILAGWTAALTLERCDGEMIPPLDDTYIYLQYARAAASGAPLEYQPGMEPTRGATSLLYPLLLAPAAAVLPQDSLFWAAWVLGVLCLAGTALAADRWMARVAGNALAWAAGLLVLFSGHFLWASVSGMDIGVFALSLTGALAAVPWYLDSADREQGIRRLSVLTGLLFLVSMARPEGVLLAGVIATGVPLIGHAPNSSRGRAVLLLGPLAAAGLTFGVNLLALDGAGPNTLAAKSIAGDPRPDVRNSMVASLPWVLGQITRALFSDFRSTVFGYGSAYLLQGLLMLGGVASVLAGWRFRKRRGALAILIAVTLAALLAGLVPAGFRSHHYRYQMPYIPLISMLVILGWAALAGRSSEGTIRKRVWIPVGLILVLMLPGLYRFGHMVARNASNIRDHQVAMGRWVKEHLPSASRIAINDAGAIAYYGERPILDLVGLVTNGPAQSHRAGPGSLYEWLEELPVTERPTHFAIFPDWFPYLRRTSLVSDKLTQFTLGENTISGADTKSLYRARWDAVEIEELPWIRRELITLWGFSLVDALDVGSLRSQSAHGYESDGSWKDTLREFDMAGVPDRMVIDGGRLVSSGERFRMQCRPGEPAALVLRTEAFREFTLEVKVNGEDAGVWEISRAPVKWTEPMFQIPGDSLTGETVEIEITNTDPENRYPSFHYWLLQ